MIWTIGGVFNFSTPSLLSRNDVSDAYKNVYMDLLTGLITRGSIFVVYGTQRRQLVNKLGRNVVADNRVKRGHEAFRLVVINQLRAYTTMPRVPGWLTQAPLHPRKIVDYAKPTLSSCRLSCELAS